jgi:hypothetical protein
MKAEEIAAAVNAIEEGKRDLAETIAKAIKEFHDATGCIVNRVDVRWWHKFGDGPSIPNVSLEAQLSRMTGSPLIASEDE